MSSIKHDSKSRYYQALGRDDAGREYQVSTKIPVEPDPVTTPSDQIKFRLHELECEAKLFASFTEAFRQGQLSQMEYDSRLAGLKYREIRIELPSAGWLTVCWLWEHIVRNRIDKDKSAGLILLVDRLLEFLQKRKELSTPITKISPNFLGDFALRLRAGDWGPKASLTVNNHVLYLKCLDRYLCERFDKKPDSKLEYEEEVCGARLSLPIPLVQQLLDHVGFFGGTATEWLILLLLCVYTPYRPGEVIKLKWKNIYACTDDAEIHLFALKPTRGMRHVARQAWVIAPLLWDLLKSAQADPNRPPSDYLLPTLRGRDTSSLSVSFLNFMKHSGISPQCTRHEVSGATVNQYGLYSLRRTFNVTAFSEARLDYAMVKTWHKSAKGQLAYLNNLDPAILASQAADLKRLPSLTFRYIPYPPPPKPKTKGHHHEI